MEKKKGFKKPDNKIKTTGEQIIKPETSSAALSGGPFYQNHIKNAIPESTVEQAKKAWEYYKQEPLVSNAVNSWLFFALGDEIKVRTENEEVEKEAEELFKRLNLNHFVKDMILQLLVKGDTMGFVNYNKNGDNIDEARCINPTSIQLIHDDYGNLEKVIQHSNEISSMYDENTIKLPMDQFFHLKWNSPQYETRGCSMILPAFESIELLREYRKAERAIAKRWTTPLQFIQVGGVYGGKTVLPDQKLIEELRDQMNSMDIESGMVVPFYVNASNYGTQGEVLNTETKVKEIKEDILVALGLSRSIVRGDGPNFATANISMHKMIISLKQIKQATKHVLDWVFTKWKETQGYTEEIHYQFSDLDLNNEADQKKLLIELYDRGLLSKTTLQQKFGFSKSIEEKRLETEKAENENNSSKLSVKDILQMVSLGVITIEEARNRLGFDSLNFSDDEDSALNDVEKIYNKHPISKKKLN